MSDLLVLQFEEGCPAARLGDWLVEAGLVLDTRRVDLGEAPSSLDGFDGVLVLGGAISSYGDLPYLSAVKQLLREAVAVELPILGVCLGGQLLALANGGRVEPNPDGPELGAELVAKRTAAATDPLFREMPIAPDVIQWHWDAVTTLPPGAIQLASSVTCENQAYRLGRLAWGVQFHIETTPEIVEAWAAHDAGRIEEYDVEHILERAAAIHDDIEEVWRPFAVGFAEIVADPSAVPPPAGAVRTSMAEPLTDPAMIRAALAAEAMHAHASNVIPLQTRRPDA
ncbi:MAG TPA: type 1 glutamine amidotransferase [Jatrophihabitans sp.]